MHEMIKAKAIELLKNNTVNRVLAWKAGEFFYDLTPAIFESDEEIEKDFAYNVFAAANLSKYLITESRKEGKIAVFLKPWDSYSFQQLLKEHRMWRDKVYGVGVACDGMCSMDAIRDNGIKAIIGVEQAGETLKLTTLY